MQQKNVLPPREMDGVVDDTTAAKIIGTSLDTLRRLRERGEFPPRVMLSARRHGTLKSHIYKWIAARTEQVSA